jgi:hypothetical protein
VRAARPSSPPSRSSRSWRRPPAPTRSTCGSASGRSRTARRPRRSCTARGSRGRGTLVCGLFRHDAAINADYWASIIRSYYDGRQTWLNTVSGNGARYGAGDLWGSIGAWFSGRWHDPGAEGYVTSVKDYMARRIWRTSDFAGGG